jgi:hypothetical protein
MSEDKPLITKEIILAHNKKQFADNESVFNNRDRMLLCSFGIGTDGESTIYCPPNTLMSAVVQTLKDYVTHFEIMQKTKNKES